MTIVTVDRREVLTEKVFVLHLNVFHTPENGPVQRIPQKSLPRHLSPKIDVVIIDRGKFVPSSEVSYGALIKHEICLLSWVEMQPSRHELVPHLKPLGKILYLGFALFLKPDGFRSIPVILHYGHCHAKTVLTVLVMPFPPLFGLYFIKVYVIALLNC